MQSAFLNVSDEVRPEAGHEHCCRISTVRHENASRNPILVSKLLDRRKNFELAE